MYDNRVAFNDISYIGRGTLSDMGAIYTLGIQPGTEVINNVCHNVESYDYGGWGLYTDEGSSHILLRDNIVYSTKCAGIHQHYGEDNVFTNNILALVDRGDGTGGVPALEEDCDAGLRSSQHSGECSAAATGEAQGACSSFSFVGNIIVVAAPVAGKAATAAQPPSDRSHGRYSNPGTDESKYPAAGLLLDANLYNGTLANMTLSNNVYWTLGSAPLDTLAFPPHAESAFGTWQALGKDAMSVVSDPLFANISARDFTLLPGSPALALGFQQIDTSTVGPRV